MSDISQRNRLIRARIATKAIFLVQGMGMGAWAACIPAFRNFLHLTDSELSLSLLAYAAGGLIGMPVAAWLVSRLSSHSTTMFLAIVYSITIALPGLAPSLSILIGTAFIAGLGKGLVDISMNTFAAAIQANWGSPIMSSFHAASSAGGLLGAICIGLMFANGYSILHSLSLLTLISLIIVSTAILLASGIEIVSKKVSNAPAFAFPTPALIGIGLLCFLVMLIEGGIADWSGVYMTTVVQVTTAQAAAGYAAFSIMMVTGRVFGDWLVHKVGERTVLLVGAISAVLGFILSLGFATFGSAALGFALVGIGVSNLVPILFSTASRSKSVSPATALAMTATVGYTGFLIGPPLIGFASDFIGLRLALVGLLASAILIGAFGPKLVTTRSVTYARCKKNDCRK